MTTNTWNSSISQSYTVKAGWSENQLPTVGEDIVIAPGVTSAVTLDAAAAFNSSGPYSSFSMGAAAANATFALDGTANQAINITSGGTGALNMSAGTITVFHAAAGFNSFVANQATVNGSGAVINLGTAGFLDVGSLNLSAGTIAVTSTGRINVGQTAVANKGVAGALNIGYSGSASGTLTMSGGTITDLAFSAVVGTFSQSGGLINSTGLASFTGGTETFSGSALFQAGTVSIANALSINGGTVQALGGGGGVTIAASNILTMGSGATTSTLDGTNGGINNSGTITGQGVVRGVITGGGSVIATGGILDVTDAQSSDTFTIDLVAGSEAKFDGASVTGGTVAFSAATIGVLGLGNAAALSGFTETVANLGIASSATSVAGDNFINVNSAVTIGDIKVVGETTNQFGAGDTQFILYTDMTDTVAIGTITLGSAPGPGVFVDWQPDATANGGALGGTDVFLATMVCYAAGTLIRTDRGDVAIENLAAGDTVVTLRNGEPVSMPIKWMGVRKLDLAAHPHPHLAAPVRIRAGAFGDDLPRRDLLVSPAHAILVDGKLVPANLLINNMTISQDTGIKAIAYYHIELEQHAIVLAEGLPAESYLDVGNRDFFSNAGLATALHPEFHANAGLKVWEEKGCAPLAIDAEDVAPIWQGLADRAESLGYTPPRFTTTRDPDLYLEANGRRLRPVVVAKGKHTFMLPAGASEIVLHSRTSAPGDLDPLSGDWRALGVAVRSMTVRSGDDHVVIPADHPALAQGWHTPEIGTDSIWRWTAGHAAIPMVSTAGPVMLDIDVAEMGTYILSRSDRDEQRLAA